MLQLAPNILQDLPDHKKRLVNSAEADALRAYELAEEIRKEG